MLLLKPTLKRKTEKKSNRVTLATLARLETLERILLEQHAHAESVITLSNMHGFNAELALRYIRVIIADKSNDVIGLLKH